ncbi:MAG: FAD-dependent oxidoreductase, partial [Silicimonas sp.]|nr:FAD-dependent oxidoreductase [Silicimonas sp.]
MVDPRYRTAFRLYPYERVPDQDASAPRRHKVVIVGGGPIGMALALDLGRRDVPVLIL